MNKQFGSSDDFAHVFMIPFYCVAINLKDGDLSGRLYICFFKYD